MFDAIGQTIAAAEIKSKNFERVALVILTDGLENASREFGRSDIVRLLARKQEQDGWLVIYLGANQDAWAVGQSFGAVASNSMSIHTDKLSFALMSASESTNIFVRAEDAQTGRRQAGFAERQRREAIKPANT